MTTIIYTPEEAIRLKNELKILIAAQPIHYGKIIKSVKYKYLFDFVNSQTPQLQDSFYTISTKVYWILNNLIDFPKCQYCGKILDNKNVRLNIGYRPVCSQSCSALSIERKQKIKQTCLAKYGVEHPAQSSIVKNKMKATCVAKYGVENPYQSDIIKAKILMTNIERRGVKYASADAQVKCVKKHTNLERFGVEYPAQFNLIKEKMKATCVAKYGVENPYQAQQFKEKLRATNLERYGVEFPQQNRNIRRKANKRYKYNNIGFDSAPELALYIYLVDHDIDFEYQPDTDFWYEYNEKQHKYMPDFKIADIYVEIKGSHLVDVKTDTWINPWNHSDDLQCETKHQCCLSNNVKILYKSEYKQYLAYINDKYGTTYLRQFKN